MFGITLFQKSKIEPDKQECPLHEGVRTRLKYGDDRFKELKDDIEFIRTDVGELKLSAARIDDINHVKNELSEVKVTVGRIDERTEILLKRS